MIVIDYRDKRPIYEQVEEKLSKLVVQGVLETDSKLPSVRALAIELSINPNTIQRAYTQLEEKGYIYTIKGKGNYVSPKNEKAAAAVGTAIAKKAIEKGITTVVFDRGGFIYQGKIQALADAAREAGLEF